MPLNATAEYYKAEEKFLSAKTREEKISALEEMIRQCPKHKGAEKLLAQLKSKLSKLKNQAEAKASRKGTAIKKEGDAQVCILGMPNSGKSTLLRRLTNAKPEVSDVPFTTSEPEVGTMDFEGVKIQLVEIPSMFKRNHMSIVQNSDAVLIVYKNKEEKHEILKIMDEFKIEKPVSYAEGDINEIKKNIWKNLSLIRIYTRVNEKYDDKRPMVMKSGSTVKDVVLHLHKDFLKYFKFARVWGSTKFPGEKVGLKYVLSDKDVIEIHAG